MAQLQLRAIQVSVDTPDFRRQWRGQAVIQGIRVLRAIRAFPVPASAGIRDIQGSVGIRVSPGIVDSLATQGFRVSQGFREMLLATLGFQAGRATTLDRVGIRDSVATPDFQDTADFLVHLDTLVIPDRESRAIPVSAVWERVVIPASLESVDTRDFLVDLAIRGSVAIRAVPAIRETNRERVGFRASQVTPDTPAQAAVRARQALVASLDILASLAFLEWARLGLADFQVTLVSLGTRGLVEYRVIQDFLAILATLDSAAQPRLQSTSNLEPPTHSKQATTAGSSPLITVRPLQ